MNKEKAIIFLLSVAKEIKRSFESPVILVTQKDYAECIFISLVEMRTALLKNAQPERVAEIVSNFHLEWLQAVQDIEDFKRKLRDMPREVLHKAIDYTTECVKTRQNYFKKYIEQLKSSMSGEDKYLIQTDLDIISDMGLIVNSALLEKQRCIRYQADQAEFYVKVLDEIEELMNWLDKLNDHLAIQFSKMLDLQVPELPDDLTKTLQQVIDEVVTASNPEAQNIAKEIHHKGRILSSMVRVDGVNELEISKVIEKITMLEDRISRLKQENSSALMALQHKTLYFEERLQSLENLKLSLKILKSQRSGARGSNALFNDKEPHIFNHMLPHQERCRLVEQLIKLWDFAIGIRRKRKSIISILSVENVKEVYSDDKDDDKHVYFYDECGRYYLNDTRQRVYKDDACGSEYLLHNAGVMVKVNEETDGVVYLYDNVGRYYVNEYGHRIYRDTDSESEYENDGLGNLVKIRPEEPQYDLCPKGPLVLEETKYLKRAIGAVLKKCLADVVLRKPSDPILFLANSLERSRVNIETQQKRVDDERDIVAGRELCNVELQIASEQYSIDGKELFVDDEFINYETDKPE